jgi:hypothetical protein
VHGHGDQAQALAGDVQHRLGAEVRFTEAGPTSSRSPPSRARPCLTHRVGRGGLSECRALNVQPG